MKTKRFTVEIFCETHAYSMLEDGDLAAFLRTLIEPGMILIHPRPRVRVFKANPLRKKRTE